MPTPIPLRSRRQVPQPFPIERGIPAPRLSRYRKYPFADMAVGDSFFVPGVQPRLLRSAARGWVTYNLERDGIAFAVRKSVANGVSGVRVWRVS